MQMEWQSSSQAFLATFALDTDACTASAVTLPDAEIAVATVVVDADGEPVPETFYPYYGTQLKNKFLPTPQATFQSTFQPYTTLALAPAAPAFLTGFPTATSITANSLLLEVEFDQQVQSVQYVVLTRNSANTAVPDLSSTIALADLFAASIGALGTIAAAGVATAINASNDRASQFQAPVALDTAENGGTFVAFFAANAGCSITYGVLTDIILPDTQAPSFVDVNIASKCNNLLTSSGNAFYTVTARLDEPASVRCYVVLLC